jgi:hypothetical protein
MKFLKFFAGALWALGVAIASAAYADPPAIIGRLNYLTGPVSFAPGEAPDDWVAATLNRPVTGGDRLWTDNNAFAEMRVGSLAVRMAPQTSMDILSLDDRAIQLRVPEGNVNLRVRRLSGDRFIEIATPTGSVVIRQPGSYRVSVDPNGDSALVAVRAGGQAELFTAGASVILRDNEEAELSGARPELFAASQLDEFDRWAADRDQRLDRVASTRYVSSEMTGYEDLDYYGEWRTVADYGNVWVPSSVPAGWAPYRDGHWVWISPWGWTWVDDQPWGFAPSHYGRWVFVDNYWAWTPGRIVERPVYSPALVAFIGGSTLSVGVSTGPAVGWIPLGYREPYIPWYRASQTYVRNVNVAYVTNVTNLTNATNVRYVNRSVPNAVTVVPRQTFVSARPVQRDLVRITDNRRIAAAPVTREPAVAQPTRTSLSRSEPGQRPPAQVISRQAVTVQKPAASQRELIAGAPRAEGQRTQSVAAVQTPPLRVIERREPVRVPVQQTPPRAENRAARQVTQAPRAETPAAPPPGVSRDEQSRRQEQAREQDGARQREQKDQQAEQQKAQAAQQLDQLERDRKQRQGQAEQQRRADLEREQSQKAVQQRQQQERAQREQQQQQKAAQDARQREQQTRQQEQRQKQSQRAVQEQQRAQQQRAQQEQQRAQQAAQAREQQRQQQAAQQQQKAAQQAQQQRAQQQQQAAQQQAQQRAQQQQAAQQQAQQRAQQQQAAQAREQQAAQHAREQQRAQPQRPEAQEKGKRREADKEG